MLLTKISVSNHDHDARSIGWKIFFMKYAYPFNSQFESVNVISGLLSWNKPQTHSAQNLIHGLMESMTSASLKKVSSQSVGSAF